MKTALPAILVGAGLVLGTAAAQEPKGEPKAAPAATVELKDQKAKVSYSIGLSIGQNFKSQSIDLDPAVIARGIADGMAGANPALTKAQIEEVMTAFEKD